MDKRVIKFRAFDTLHSVMLQSVAIYADADHIGLSLDAASDVYTDEQLEGTDNHIYGGDDWIYVMSQFALMQFTGLLDKNGKEIYEGDICRGPNGKHWVIEWLGHSWCMTNSIIPNGRMKFGGEETHAIDKWLMLPPSMQNLEVIGNIHENPELLTP